MLQAIDPVRFDAFVQMLAEPDPGDLPRRRHVVRCEGDPNRRATRLPKILMAWLQRRYLETDVEEPLTSAMRTLKRQGRPVNSGIRLLRPTGTG